MLCTQTRPFIFFFFFFNDTATTEIYTLSLHDALPIFGVDVAEQRIQHLDRIAGRTEALLERSEEHTSELQSRLHLVCRLLLEKKKNKHGPQNLVVRGLTTKTDEDPTRRNTIRSSYSTR